MTCLGSGEKSLLGELLSLFFVPNDRMENEEEEDEVRQQNEEGWRGKLSFLL